LRNQILNRPKKNWWTNKTNSRLLSRILRLLFYRTYLMLIQLPFFKTKNWLFL